MNPYDKEKTRQIWKRVLGEEESCECRAADSEQLLRRIAAEKAGVCTYRELARCAGGACREQLCCIVREAMGHSKKLETLYFLWTGECACVKPGPAAEVCCMADGLRERYQAEAEGAAELRRMAEQLPEYSSILYGMAGEKDCRAERILKLLQYYV